MAAIKVYETEIFSDMLEENGFQKTLRSGNCYILHTSEDAPVGAYCLENDGTATIRIGDDIQLHTTPFKTFLEILSKCYKSNNGVSKTIKIIS